MQALPTAKNLDLGSNRELRHTYEVMHLSWDCGEVMVCGFREALTGWKLCRLAQF